VDRLADVVRGGPNWHMREIERVLVDEDWGDGSFPTYRDIQTVGDIMRIGAAGLSMRFREVDPEIWKWLIEKLEATS